MSAPAPRPETDALVERYARRSGVDRYSLLRPDVLLAAHERERALLRLYATLGWHDLTAKLLIEVGCGTGAHLLDALRHGYRPEHLSGIELLPDRLAFARASLPAAVRLIEGEASLAPLAPDSADVVLAATVFSSLLDDAFQRQLADAMWAWVRPGGGVLVYDFTLGNPRNPDVRGVPLARLRELFPRARWHSQRLTLAPPLARAACGLHPALARLLGALPLLRTHRLSWGAKG